MVEIIAVIRPNRIGITKEVLIKIGYPAFTCHKTVGRGKKPVDLHLPDGSSIRTSLVTKRVVSIIVPDEAEEEVVQAIISVNSTGMPGDGKIFVSEITQSYSVRTGKKQ